MKFKLSVCFIYLLLFGKEGFLTGRAGYELSNNNFGRSSFSSSASCLEFYAVEDGQDVKEPKFTFASSNLRGRLKLDVILLCRACLNEMILLTGNLCSREPIKDQELRLTILFSCNSAKHCRILFFILCCWR